MKTRVDVIDAEETLGAIMAVFLDASMAAAEAFRDDQIARVAARLKPDNSNQKTNTQATIDRKGHDVALRDRGTLENPSEYTIRVVDEFSIAGVTLGTVQVTHSLGDVLEHLGRMGYGVFTVSNEVEVFYQQKLDEGLLIAQDKFTDTLTTIEQDEQSGSFF